MDNTGPFAVVAHRWGLRDAHSYVIGCYTNEDEAYEVAVQTVDDRGGKYGVEVTDCNGDQIHYIESPYFGMAGQYNEANHAADIRKGILSKHKTINEE